MPSRILLIRHGRSSHVQPGLLNRAEFDRWREAYEAAGVAEDDVPPPALQQLAVNAGVVLASDAPRAVQSAKLLAPGQPVLVSPLLRELDLLPPKLGGLRMSLRAWAVAIGIQWLARRVLRRPPFTAPESARAKAAAEWMSELAQRHGTVVAVTHGSIRGVIARELLDIGWRKDAARRRWHHWSVWSLSRATLTLNDA